ncbi:MAG: alpha-L-fucosidase [Verrucomicrobiota bacterium]
MMHRFLAMLFFAASPLVAQATESLDPYAGETKEQKDQRMAWWREARFGMFIHWGVYAVPAGVYEGKDIAGIGEWIMNRGKIPVARYREYAKNFNPVKYDPESWVKLAKDAGMKYIIITSKHHDGFALFDSKVTGWDVVDATPYKKDLLKPLAEACRKHGMKLGFYYSQAQDWVHPGGAGNNWDPTHKSSMDEYIKTIAVPQVREILENYGDVAVLWFDTPKDMNQERAELILPSLKKQPGIIYNDRLGGGYKGDTNTPEQHIPPTGFPGRDWETCMTMNETWGFKSKDHKWKPASTLVRNLIDIASKGGNYLLNVGPTAEGEIPQPSVTALKEIGTWMKTNGEAIHGTTASPFRRLAWGRCTVKKGSAGDTLYFHVFDWPQDGKLVIPGLTAKISQARVIGGETIAATTNQQGVITLNVGAKFVDPIATVIALEVAPGWKVGTVALAPAADGSLTLGMDFVELHQTGAHNHMAIETKAGKPGVGSWTNPANWIGWAFRTGEPKSYEVIAEIAAAKPAQIQLHMGETKLSASFQPTGGDDKFATQSLGKIELPPGDHELGIRPVTTGWSPVNLRSVTLKPVK